MDDLSLLPKNHSGPLYIFNNLNELPRVDGREGKVEPIVGFSYSDQARSLSQLAIPVRHRPYSRINNYDLEWTSSPERYVGDDPQTDNETHAKKLFQRAENIWDRFNDLDLVLSDPLNLWTNLAKKWSKFEDTDEPRMDIIVKHAKHLKNILDTLSKKPRRILRRHHRMVPLSKVQEMDRRSMTWLIRQPGETLVERAGNSQRVLSVAREENFDTLENRVLRAYTELAYRHSRDYLERNKKRTKTRRLKLVENYKKHCRNLSQTLRQNGVRKAEPGVTPNFVLLENALYKEVWKGWQELIKKTEIEDDLWRWQARSWEEFSALCVMVGLITQPTSRLIASAPIDFRDEQDRGSWIKNDNPLGVFYIEETGLVVEVQYRLEKPNTWQADLACPIWLRIGEIDKPNEFLNYVAVWPTWDNKGGTNSIDLNDLSQVMQTTSATRKLKACLVLPPCDLNSEPQTGKNGTNVFSIELGSEGFDLALGIENLRNALGAILNLRPL